MRKALHRLETPSTENPTQRLQTAGQESKCAKSGFGEGSLSPAILRPHRSRGRARAQGRDRGPTTGEPGPSPKREFNKRLILITHLARSSASGRATAPRQGEQRYKPTHKGDCRHAQRSRHAITPQQKVVSPRVASLTTQIGNMAASSREA